MRPRYKPRGPVRTPTVEEINALAKKERVPARIAKGELEGKMKCRVWRKLHAEEAKRFDQVYVLMDQNPGLSLPDAFGVLQSGLSVQDFLSKRSRTQRKAQVKEARTTVKGEEIDAFIDALVKDKEQVAFVLADRTVFDVPVKVDRVSFRLERHGKLEKLQVVLLAKRALWESISGNIQRDPKLFQKPTHVERQPEKRPVADPRPFLDSVGKPLSLTLRNGILLDRPLQTVGPFDLLVGDEGGVLFVPLHAIVRWQAGDSASGETT